MATYGWKQFILVSQQDWKYWQHYPEMQFSSVNLEFHESCVNIYACLFPPYVLQLGKFTSIIFPSPLLSHFSFSSLPIYKCEVDIPEKESVKLTTVSGVSSSSSLPTLVAIIIPFHSTI